MRGLLVGSGETGIYIIDRDYRIIYLNEAAKLNYPNIKVGMYCYQGVNEESTPCSDCPVAKGETGRMMFYNTAYEQWLDISTGTIEWPGYGECRIILFRPVDEKNKNLFYNLADTTIYDELFELNLLSGTYKILFHQNDKFVLPEREGNIEAMCRDVADNMVHPDDRDSFLQLFDFSSLVERLKDNGKILKGEFRKKLLNGGYCWASLTLVLFRCGDEKEMIIMCFIQDIDARKKKEAVEQEKREEKDSLTGLFRYGPFFNRVEELLLKALHKQFYMVAVDIEHFKLFNEWYGEEEGDRFLINIGKQLQETEKQYGLAAGYMGGDDFAILLPEDAAIVEQLEKKIYDYVKKYGGSTGFLPAFGIYPVKERDIPVSMMYDRAVIALNTVKGNYRNRTGWYDAEMKQRMEDDQVLLSEIQRALDNREFVFYVQPQCNILTGRIIGMESLVRWEHPVRGLVSPGEFIPLLEKNGFITNLDLYIWDMVCQYLQKWQQSGHKPVPVSVNMSRMDIYAIDVVSEFKDLIKKYNIDPGLLEIEITESAYAEDDSMIRKVVEELRKAGFPVLMDDFGSGYSSLNMLKDVNVDVIKIDTKFLDMSENSRSRGMGILETVVRMAKIMQMKVIAEGVEEKEQADFLRNIGCIYAQGYYYYRPMPVADMEKLLSNEDNIDYRGIQARQMTQLKLEDLFNEDITSETMLNNMLGGIALYDVYEDQCEILRVNEEYYRITGDNPVDLEERKRFVFNQVYGEDLDWVLNIFEKAYENPVRGAEGIFRRYRLNREMMWLHLRAFFLREQDGHRLYYGSVSDATEQMEQRQRLEASQKMLTDVLKMAGKSVTFDNVMEENQWVASAVFAQMAPGGFMGIYCEKGFPIYFVNQELLQLLQFDSYDSLIKDIEGKMKNLIHPDDFKQMHENSPGYYAPGMEHTFRYRMRKRDGSWFWVLNKGRVVQTADGKLAIVSACMDITDSVLTQEKLREANQILLSKNEELEFLSSGVPGGYYRFCRSEKMELLHTSSRFLEILDYTESDIKEKFHNRLKPMIHPEDYEKVLKKLKKLNKEKRLTRVEYRMLSNHGYIWVLGNVKLSLDEKEEFLYGVILNIEEIVTLRRESEQCRIMLDQMEQWHRGKADSITGLLSFQAGSAMMKEWLSRRRAGSSALAVFDFSGLKGQLEGDEERKTYEWKKQVKKLKKYFRENDIIFAGREYEVMVLLKNIREDDMEKKAKRIISGMNQDKTDMGQEILLVNAGYVMLEEPCHTFEEFSRNARTALEQAREQGPGFCAKYE